MERDDESTGATRPALHLASEPPPAAPSARGTARQVPAYAAAVLAPLVVAVAFDHPARRVLLPGALMFAIVVVVSMVGGRLPGIVAALTATASLWFFNIPPGMSFRLTSGDDAAAVLVTGLLSLALVLLIARLQEADRASVAAAARADLTDDVQRQSIATMQRALLPQVVPPTHGVEIGSYYQTGGDDGVPVGGDWFAFIPLSPASMGLAIGDVAGHGLPAVTAMAEYRFAMRVVATEHRDPASVLEHFDAVTAMYRRSTFTSCIYGILDASIGTFTFTSAGHPPPILVRDGTSRLLGSKPHGPIIGLDATTMYGCSTELLEPGDLLVLYTDGIIERRGESIEIGMDRLCQRARDLLAFDLDAQCEQIVRDLVGVTSADDAAIVIARYEPAGDARRPRGS